MARAHDIHGLRPDMPFRQAASVTVAARTRELTAHSDGVLDVADVERLHAMRVATRRLRAVLEFYAPCFPSKDFDETLTAVKALADALGARRDPDVQLEALVAFADAGEAERQPGLDEYRRRLTDRQEAANLRLADALETVRSTDLTGRLDALAAGVWPGSSEGDA